MTRSRPRRRTSIASGRTSGESSPASRVPPISSLPSSSGRTPPTGVTTWARRRKGTGSVAARWPFTRWCSIGTRPVGGTPVATMTAPGWMSPIEVSRETTFSPAALRSRTSTPVATVPACRARPAANRSGWTRACRGKSKASPPCASAGSYSRIASSLRVSTREPTGMAGPMTRQPRSLTPSAPPHASSS